MIFRRYIITWGLLLFLLLTLMGLFFASCTALVAPTNQVVTPASPTFSATALPSQTLTPSPTTTPTRTVFPDPNLPAWQNYPPPQIPPVTAVPLPASGVSLPEDVRVMALLGTDQDAPYVGRTDAIILLFYHPRFGRASMLSIPPDLFVYIPGFTMQRLDAAYSLGGFRLLADTIEYNFNVRPSEYVMVHLNDFAELINDLGGLELTVLRPYPKACNGIRAGFLQLNGNDVLCYIRYRDGMDELDRNLRQQQVLYRLIEFMVQGGNLARLPDLYAKYGNIVETDLTLDELLGNIPLVLRLGDPGRLGFYTLGEAELSTWVLPNIPISSSAFLPRRPQIIRIVQEAIDFTNIPASQSEILATLEYELTISPTITNTPTVTITPTFTNTPTRTTTSHPTITRTRTRTPIPSASNTRTKTVTRTPTVTQTFTKTPTATATPGAIVFSQTTAGGTGIFLIPWDGSASPQVILDGSDDTHSGQVCDWNGASQQLLFEQGLPSSLFAINLDGSNVVSLPGQPVNDNTQASFSPDGSWVVFVNGSAPNRQIYLVKTDGTNLLQLTTANDNYSPDWSPVAGENRIVFVSNNGSSIDLYTLDLGGSLPPGIPVASPLLLGSITSDEEDTPRYSPDGGKIAFSRKTAGHWDIYSASASDLSGQQNLTPALALSNEKYPAWSFSGREIVFISNMGGQTDIYRMLAADGSGLSRLTNSPDIETRVIWLP